MMYPMFCLLFAGQALASLNPGLACSEVCDCGNNLTTDDFEWRNAVHMRNHPKDGLNSHGGEPAQLPDQFAHFGTILAHVEGERTRLLNRIIIPALSLTMLLQDLRLLRDLWARTQIAGMSVAGDQAQRLLFAGARNQNRRVRTREALWEVRRAFDAVVLPLVGTLVSQLSLPHAQADLHHLLQPLVALFEWRERQSRAACLLFVIASANAQPRTGHQKAHPGW